MLGLVRLHRSVSGGDFHVMVIGQLTETGNHIHIVLFEQELHALAHLLSHTATALDHRLEIRGDGAVNSNTVVGSV